MGQKVDPRSFRLIIKKNWKSRWYANKQEFGDLLYEDVCIRKFLEKKFHNAMVSAVKIARMSGKIEIVIVTGRPGLIIGKKGVEIEQIKKDLSKLTGKEVWVEVEEVKRPDLDAQILADSIARQIERRIPFRRVMKKALQAAQDAGALGIRLQLAGRLGGAEIARSEWYKEGSTPLHTLRANIDYATSRAETTYGSTGVKVHICTNESPRIKQEAAV